MIETTAYILFGYEIDEKKLNELLPGESSESGLPTRDEFYDNFLFSCKEHDDLQYILDVYFGKRGFFGHILDEEDTMGDQDDAFIIPDNHQESLNKINHFASTYPELFKLIISCATRKEPKMMLVIQKS